MKKNLGLIGLIGLMVLMCSCSMLTPQAGEAQPGIVGTLGNGVPELSDLQTILPVAAAQLEKSNDPTLQLVGAYLAGTTSGTTTAPVAAVSRAEKFANMNAELAAERREMVEEINAYNALTSEMGRTVELPVAEPDVQPAVDAPPLTEPLAVETTAKEQLGELLQNSLVQTVITKLNETGTLDAAVLKEPGNATALAAVLANPLTATMIPGYLATGTLDPTPLLEQFPVDVTSNLSDLMQSELVQMLLIQYATGSLDPALLFDPARLDDIIAILSNAAARDMVDGWLSTGTLNLSALTGGS